MYNVSNYTGIASLSNKWLVKLNEQTKTNKRYKCFTKQAFSCVNNNFYSDLESVASFKMRISWFEVTTWIHYAISSHAEAT